MFQKGDILKNKYVNHTIRLLVRSHYGRTDLMPIQYTGYFLPGHCDSKHYIKISYWKWLMLVFLHTIKICCYLLSYQQNNKLGLIDTKDSLKYKNYVWREYPYNTYLAKSIKEYLFQQFKLIIPTFLLE